MSILWKSIVITSTETTECFKFSFSVALNFSRGRTFSFSKKKQQHTFDYAKGETQQNCVSLLTNRTWCFCKDAALKDVSSESNWIISIFNRLTF